MSFTTHLPPFNPMEIEILQEDSKEEKNSFTCQAVPSSQWYRDHFNQENYICNKSYRVQLKILSQKGAFEKIRSSPTCQTTSTLQWYKDLSDKQKDLSHRCYKAQKRTLAQTDESISNPRKKPKIL